MSNIDWSQQVTVADKGAAAAERGYLDWKAEREERVRAIVVEVDGLRFDGDEDSQNRMTRAVAAADLMTETTEWTLADNTIAMVSVQALKTACRLAGEEQTRIWNEGRPA
ncbi:DUF4376 domain-containing protein [Aeromonas sanarellii]